MDLRLISRIKEGTEVRFSYYDTLYEGSIYRNDLYKNGLLQIKIKEGGKYYLTCYTNSAVIEFINFEIINSQLEEWIKKEEEFILLNVLGTQMCPMEVIENFLE